MSPRVLSAWLMVALALPQLLATAAPTYSVTPITGKFTAAVDMNNAGQIAINNLASDVPFRFGYILGNTTTETVGSLGGHESTIRGLNNKGEAVGSSQTASGANHAFFYSAGRIHDLTVASGLDSATDINDRGDIAGQVDDRAAVVRAGGKVEVFGSAGSGAGAINNLGDVLGDFVIEGKGIHPFLYSRGRLTDLGTLGGTFSVGTALNDAGAVVGSGSTASGQFHAFLYNDGVMADLAPSTTSSGANGINQLGQVVGTMDKRAFLYANGTLTDLNTLIARDAGFLLASALAINDRRQILATACDPSGAFCDSTVRLDPIPPIAEPGGKAMLLAGTVLLGMHSLVRRRRGRAAWTWMSIVVTS